jgi:hypothetical protein
LIVLNVLQNFLDSMERPALCAVERSLVILCRGKERLSENQIKECTMSDSNMQNTDAGQQKINGQDEAQLREWSKKLDATPDELREAIGAVGELASDVELHLKGSRSTSNSERVRNAL